MSRETYDAVVIGAGHNGLACAARLGMAGMRVCVLERRARPGGLAQMVEFRDGYRVPGLLLDRGMVRPFLLHELKLERHGADPVEPPPAHLLADGSPPEPVRAAEAPGFLARRDRESWDRMIEFATRILPALSAIMDEEPPELVPENASGLVALAARGFRLARLPANDFYELARAATSSAADWLDDWFDDPRWKGRLALPAVESAFAGPRSPGTAANALMALALGGDEIRGGPASLVEALQKAAADAGVSVRCDATVAEIAVEGGRAIGARLVSGELVRAERVISSASPRATFLDLLDPACVSFEQAELARNLRARGATAILLLGVRSPLELQGAGAVERAVFAPDLDHLERAFDDAKYGRFSEAPAFEVRVPSMSRDDLAPAGHHVVQIHALFAPRALEGGWTDAMREGFAEAIMDQLCRFAPTLRERVVASRLVTPSDIEERFAVPGGHLHHIEHAPDQLLFLRPDERCSRYRTEIPGLYLAGAGCHPGGGLSGAPGVLAARAVLCDAR